MPSEQQIIEAIRAGNQLVISQLYREYRVIFFRWIRKFTDLRPEEIADIYQDTIIAFYTNVMHGKIEQLESSIKTYLFSIGKYRIYKYYRSRRKEEVVEDMEDILPEVKQLWYPRDLELSERKELIHQCITALGDPCNKIVRLFYYRKFCIEAIQRELGYKSAEVVRSQKRRCMQYLKKTLTQRFKEELI